MDPANILVVGDKLSGLTALEVALSDAAYQIIGVDSHDKCHSIDLVILEHTSPAVCHSERRDNGSHEQLNGLTLQQNEQCQLIRETYQGTCPILFYIETVDHTPDPAGLACQGVVDFLYPPLSPQIIQVKIRNLIELHRKTVQLTEQNRLLAGIDHQMAQQRQAIVGQLTAGIAHDFNNILAVITLYGQLLQKVPDSTKYAQYLEIIHQQANRGADLISQLLDFGRQSLMQPTSVDLVSFLRDVVKLLSRTFPENIEVTLSSRVESLYVRVDPTHLQQVFMNLAINARDAMPGEGEFHLSLGAIDISDEDDVPIVGMKSGLWAKVTATDNGCGMSDEVQARIFEPFFTTKGPDEGTGLGLAQVHGIIQQFGGEIQVSSAVGTGSTFVVYLPMDELISVPFVQAGESGKPEAISVIAQKTILLVEDEPVVRKALETVFDELGFGKVIVAGDGREALALYRNRSGPIDLVFSDMVMPKMGGLELFEALRDEVPTLKMIITTGYPLENGGEALLERGISDWLLKPFTMEELITKVTHTLEA